MRRTTDGKLTTRVGQFHTTNAVLFRLEVFESFCYLLTGILIGETKGGTVRASVFCPRGLMAAAAVRPLLSSQNLTSGLHGEVG
jgi:hypothetical protein